MKIICKKCGARLNVRDELKGKMRPCPRCQENLHLQPDLGGTAELLNLDLEDGIFQGTKIEPEEEPDDDRVDSSSEEMTQSSRKRTKKKALVENASNTPADQSDSKGKRQRSRRTPLKMLIGVADGPFWRGAIEHLLFMSLSLACVGGLIGFLLSLVRSAVVAGLLFNLIGVPTMLVAFFMLSYPASCFWRVFVGSASGHTDVSEWPESNLGEWVFDMLFVAYLLAMSIFLSAGIAKLREVASPGQYDSTEYWQLIGSVAEVNKIAELPKLLGPAQRQLELKVESSRPVFIPGPAWWTTLGAFILIFPLIAISCLDSNSPLFVPWSPRVLISLIKNFVSWLIALIVFAAIVCSAAALFVVGSSIAPFWTFTLCSPLAAVAALIYSRLLGRLSYQIANT